MRRVAALLSPLLLGWTVSKGVVLAVNAVTFPRLRPQAAPPGAPRVSVLIPARNEAHNLPCTLPAVLAQGAHEVMVLDDGSTDGTGEVARSLMARALGARVISGQPLPDGWHGKPWACHQLAQAATGDVLIFTDADVSWHPGALGAVLQKLSRTGADLLSVQPRQDNLTPGERLLTPLVDNAVLLHFPYPLMTLPQPAASMANGQVMAFRRAAYERVGGHGLVRAEVLEDTQFARRLKARGGTVAVALGRGAISVRMYRSYPESVRGFSKNILPLHLHSRPFLLLGAAAHLLAFTLPWLLPAALPGVRALRATSLLERALVAFLAGRRRPADLAEGLLGPVTPLLALPVYLRALRRQVKWKGREYQQ